MSYFIKMLKRKTDPATFDSRDSKKINLLYPFNEDASLPNSINPPLIRSPLFDDQGYLSVNVSPPLIASNSVSLTFDDSLTVRDNKLSVNTDSTSPLSITSTGIGINVSDPIEVSSNSLTIRIDNTSPIYISSNGISIKVDSPIYITPTFHLGIRVSNPLSISNNSLTISTNSSLSTSGNSLGVNINPNTALSTDSQGLKLNFDSNTLSVSSNTLSVNSSVFSPSIMNCGSISSFTCYSITNFNENNSQNVYKIPTAYAAKFFYWGGLVNGIVFFKIKNTSINLIPSSVRASNPTFSFWLCRDNETDSAVNFSNCTAFSFIPNDPTRIRPKLIPARNYSSAYLSNPSISNAYLGNAGGTIYYGYPSYAAGSLNGVYSYQSIYSIVDVAPTNPQIVFTTTLVKNSSTGTNFYDTQDTEISFGPFYFTYQEYQRST